jgi:hypothetical protein
VECLSKNSSPAVSAVRPAQQPEGHGKHGIKVTRITALSLKVTQRVSTKTIRKQVDDILV